MSIIVPAGNKNVDWSPKEEPMVKTASVATDAKEEVNALYEAAKLVIEAAKNKKNEDKDGTKEEKQDDSAKAPDGQKKEAGIIPGVPDGTGPHGMGADKGRGKGPCGKGGKEIEGNDGASEDPASVVEDVAEEVKEVSKMEAAVDKIDEAVVELKEVVQEEKGETEDIVEVELEVSDDKVTDIPGKDVSQSDIIVESTPACACAETKKEVKEAKKDDKKEDKKDDKKDEKKEVAMDKSASTEEEFCKFAKLTPANRQKLAKYWKDALGYPADYVSLMVKDYEK